MEISQVTKADQHTPPQTPGNMEVVNNLFNKDIDDDAYNSEEDPNHVVNFDNELKYIKELNGVDIVFVVDCTASMNPIMGGVKRFIRKLLMDALQSMSQYLSDDVDLLTVGMVSYRDHPPQDTTFITQVYNLTSDFVDFKAAVKKLNAKGGGDGPEAVVDGLFDAVNTIKWRQKSEKFIYHILDAPPHGTEFTNGKDAFPQGCPCGNDWEEIILKMRELDIDYTVIKFNNDINTMIEKFSEKIKVDVMEPNISYDESKKISQG